MTSFSCLGVLFVTGNNCAALKNLTDGVPAGSQILASTIGFLRRLSGLAFINWIYAALNNPTDRVGVCYQFPSSTNGPTTVTHVP